MKLGAIAFAAALGAAAAPHAAAAATLRVANQGADTPSCGSKAEPCRSISQAIALAGAGDRIKVGPGLYGDLDRDGIFEPAAGEEAAPAGCSCVVHVNKRLTIESDAGAGSTVLTGGDANVDIVRVTADDVVFGRARKGFRLIEGGAPAAIVTGINVDASGTRIEANVVEEGGFNGFAISGTGNEAIGNVAVGHNVGFFVSGHGATFRGNLARESSIEGFSVGGTAHRLDGNRAENGNRGFNVQGGAHVLAGNRATGTAGEGFALVASGLDVRGNLASDNAESGFHLLAGGGVVSGNVAVANDIGFRVGIADFDASANAAYGNTAAGFAVEVSPFRLERLSLGGNRACGVDNRSTGPIEVIDSWWGSADGPGPPPADDTCDMLGSTTQAVPFATKPLKVKPIP